MTKHRVNPWQKEPEPKPDPRRKTTGRYKTMFTKPLEKTRAERRAATMAQFVDGGVRRCRHEGKG